MEVRPHPATSLPPIRVDEETFLRDHFDLPPMPAVVTRLVETLQTGRATAQEVADLLSKDPGLVAQILKIVNSAYYGLPRRISQVKHAVAYLGLAEIERLVLTASLMNIFPAEESEEFTEIWFHSFYAAVVSRCLSRRYTREIDAEELHTAVLLHDIGKLVYLRFFPDHYREMTHYCRTHGRPLNAAERDLGFPSHGWFGALLCDRWNLPGAVKRACRWHELEDLNSAHEDAAGHEEEIAFVCVANLLTNLAVGRLSPDSLAAIQQATMEILACDDAEFLLLMGEVYERKGEVEAFLAQG